MRFIPTSIHGMMDYLMSAILIASPWLFGFARGGSEQWVPIVLGVAMTIASLFTNYEMGVVRRIPMKTHLALDLVSGALLAVSPWLFGFSDYVSTPHLVLGLLEIGASLMTRTTPSFSQAGAPETGRPIPS